MLGPIGNDILDIGSRKAAMTRAAANAAADPLGLGRPGQFEVPNVMDVRFIICCERAREILLMEMLFLHRCLI